MKYFCAGCPDLWSALSTALVPLPLETASSRHLLATEQPKDYPLEHLGALGTLLLCQASFRPDGSVSCPIWGTEQEDLKSGDIIYTIELTWEPLPGGRKDKVPYYHQQTTGRDRGCWLR